MKTERWFVTSNDGTTVTLRRETDEKLEESTIQRPDNTTPTAWRELWKVGAEFSNAEYHDRMRFEAVRRKGAGVLNASEQAVVNRWNRPDRPIKQVEDCTESLRVFLKGVEQVSMLEFARLLYVKHSATNPELASEYTAISSCVTLLNFIERCESLSDPPLDTETLDEMVTRANSEEFWKGRDVKSK
jgi:hypothetical protein